MPADMRGDWRSAIGDRVSCDEGGKERVLDSGKVLMGGIAALSINGPSPVISLSISDFPPRPHLLKQISQSESPGPVRTLCLRMVFVDMDAITFYERPPPKAGLSGDKRLPASNRNVPTVGQQRESHQAFAPSNRPSWTLQEFDLIKILDMTTSSLNEPLNPFGKLGPKVKATGVDVGDMANETCINDGRDRTSSRASQDLPCLEELLFSAKEMQEPQRAGEGGAHLTRMSVESLGPVVENDWKESDSPKSGWGKSKEEQILLDDESSDICDNKNAERQGGDIQDTEWKVGSGSSIHTSDGSISEEQDREQGGKWNSLSTPPTSVVSSEAGSTMHQKNEFSTPHPTTPRHNACLILKSCPQIHGSIDEGHLDIEKDPLTSEDKGAEWDDKAAKADNGFQGDNNEKNALLRPTKKKFRSAAGKKPPLDRRVKRRFSSPLSSDEETETGSKSDIGSSVTLSHQCTYVGDPQPGGLWEIRKLIDMKTVDGVEHFWVDWEPTWICESELEGARELVDGFKARLSVLCENKNKPGETDATGESQPKKRRGRPWKRS